MVPGAERRDAYRRRISLPFGIHIDRLSPMPERCRDYSCLAAQRLPILLLRACDAPLGEWLDYVLRRIAPKIRCSWKLAQFRTVKSGVNHPPTGGSTVLATTTPYIIPNALELSPDAGANRAPRRFGIALR